MLTEFNRQLLKARAGSELTAYWSATMDALKAREAMKVAKSAMAVLELHEAMTAAKARADAHAVAARGAMAQLHADTTARLKAENSPAYAARQYLDEQAVERDREIRDRARASESPEVRSPRAPNKMDMGS